MSEDARMVIRAEEDESVNFVTIGGRGTFEARYVRRTEEYMIAYLSSHTGCDRSCRFCHLTATGQTSMSPATVDDYGDQISTVLAHHDTRTVRPTRMNVNFMARGEPMMNPVLRDPDLWNAFTAATSKRAAASGIEDVRYNVSSIMPAVNGPSIPEAIGHEGVTLYYSLYSMRRAFRRRWLPKAMDPVRALDDLAAWQDLTGNPVVLHWAFIEGENDDEGTIAEIVEAVRTSGLRPRFNAVRYNPFDERRGREPSLEVVERCFAALAEAFGDPSSRIVPRVGYSAKASCGMFVDGREA
jgi:23S rRNA (adenine2503-C2)-methyltransferase